MLCQYCRVHKVRECLEKASRIQLPHMASQTLSYCFWTNVAGILFDYWDFVCAKYWKKSPLIRDCSSYSLSVLGAPFFGAYLFTFLGKLWRRSHLDPHQLQRQSFFFFFSFFVITFYFLFWGHYWSSLLFCSSSHCSTGLAVTKSVSHVKDITPQPQGTVGLSLFCGGKKGRTVLRAWSFSPRS